MAGKALGDPSKDGAIVFYALETAAEKITHIEQVLLVQRSVEVELLLEGFLDLRSDPGIRALPKGTDFPESA